MFYQTSSKPYFKFPSEVALCFALFHYNVIFLFPFLFLVLKARIQQLQSDVVLDVQHAKVQFLKSPSFGGGVSSGRTVKGSSKDKSDIPKSGKVVTKGASKSQPSRWMKKLSEENINKLKKQQILQQKVQRNAKEKLPASKSSLMPTGATHKTMSSPAKKRRGGTKLSDEIRSSVSSAAAVTAATSSKAAEALKTSKQKRRDSKSKVSDKDATKKIKDGELTEIAELEKRLNDQVQQRIHLSMTERFQESSTGSSCRDIQLSIRSYLEACVFIGDIERSQSFLVSQHRVMSRRKLLTTDVYNIMMRVWAKKVSVPRPILEG